MVLILKGSLSLLILLIKEFSPNKYPNLMPAKPILDRGFHDN